MKTSAYALFALLLSGCFISEDEHAARQLDFDNDGDGALGLAMGGDDCDDDDANIRPGADELCDGVDNNCDGEVDEDLLVERYADEDGDGHGGGEMVLVCPGTAGYVEDGGDCDDTEATVHPGHTEECDNLDNDCDDIVDNDISSIWFADTDEDGFGDPDAMVEFCLEVDGYVDDDSDCDDANIAVNPDGTEVCGNGIDDDCNGVIDDDASDLYSVWADTDGDGFGDAGSSPSTACGPLPTGFVENAYDCDDSLDTVNPDATETCATPYDDDCNGLAVEGDDVTWYVDDDGDGFGTDALTASGCESPGPGWTEQADDCDDTRSGVFPGADELCNTVDDDCNGTVDDDPDVPTWWADTDGDGFGDLAAPSSSCSPDPADFVQNTLDCDDSAGGVNPTADETCADVGIDNDCDGDTDDPPIDPIAWYPDTDADTFGDEDGTPVMACTAPADHVDDSSDCDDSSGAVNPSATELCNTIDDDCNGDVDSDATDKTPHYADLDDDGFGDDAAPLQACGTEPNVSALDTDCDDTVASVNPSASEVCNGIDDDCNTLVDDNTTTVQTWYLDSDDDGFGDPSITQDECTQPVGYVLQAGDCDDSVNAVNPSADELCSTTGVDDDCDGNTDDATATDAQLWYIDSDNDGYGELGSTAQAACTQPVGFVLDETDCDDGVNAVNPGADELCSSTGVDDDCDGLIDDPTATDALTYYPDLDSDGFGDDGASGQVRCVPTSVQVSDNSDCNDGDVAINPAADELCSTTGIDDNCSGAADESTAVDAVTWYEDGDDDNFGLTSSTLDACNTPAGYVSAFDDCDDTVDTTYPGAPLACDDATDADCDGALDNDADLDGFSSDTCGGSDCDDAVDTTFPGQTGLACDDSTDADCDGSVDNDADDDNFSDDACGGTDCNDGLDTAYPGAAELCDDTSDNDCDGEVDNDADDDGFLASGCGGTDCDDSDGTINPGAGNCQAYYSSCSDALANGETVDGTYTIDPDGTGGNAEFDVTCDLSGGGWTEVFCDDMSSPDAGWSPSATVDCGSFGTILGPVGNANGITHSGVDLLGIPHDQVAIDFTFLELDSWNNEDFWLEADGVEVYRDTFNKFQGNHECFRGGANDFLDDDHILSVSFDHSSADNSLTLNFDNDLNGGANDEYAAIDDVCVYTRDTSVLPATYESCKDILDNGASTGDGVYSISPPSGGVIDVYCDMTSDSGGWTLVGRSNPGNRSGNATDQIPNSSGFGWKQSTGLVTNDSAAYSLDVDATGIAFDEILFGSYSSGKSWQQVYRRDVPATLLSAYGTTTDGPDAPDHISEPDCNPENWGPWMLRYVGRTDKDDHFWFRDLSGDANLGLGEDGWYTYYSDCNNGGALNTEPGMIMVR